MQVAMTAGAFALALTLGMSTAASGAETACTLRVKSGNLTSYRDGVTPGTCVVPSLRDHVDNIAAGNRAGWGSWGVFRASDCTGTEIADGLGESDYIPPLTFGSIRLFTCP
ncbi:hypothetical protein ACIBUY_10145 [Streptomyces sp. NPDC050085]|uniref:hypothetical protein n=1 Tax=Streptomyces sp. NPDC050085 TaxID=3365600 RepID=UPI0037904734